MAARSFRGWLRLAATFTGALAILIGASPAFASIDVSLQVTTNGAAGAPGTPGIGTTSLPFTGVELLPWLITAFVLMFAGSVLIKIHQKVAVRGGGR